MVRTGGTFMKYSKLILIIMFILAWLTLPLLGKKSVKRFMAAGIFISLVVTFESILAKKRRWWWWYERIHPKLQGGFPLTWGPFLIGSMWILKLTYGKFFVYLIANFIIDTLFTYPFVNFLKKQGIASLVRLKKYQLSMLFFVKSLLLYGFQYIKERLTVRN
jgi:hypothetical protein